MKRGFKYLKAIVFIIVIILVIHIIVEHIEKRLINENYSKSALKVPSIDNLLDDYKNTTSDIEGMTQYDKYVMGLKVFDDSDSDYDGLTDKEEIEIYNSDPLKDSTAGDLYSDKYKMNNNMDLHTYYEYIDPFVFEYNECAEVSIIPSKPNDFKTVVRDITHSEKLCRYNILKEYNIYNTEGIISININELDILDKKIDVFYYEKGKIKSCKYYIKNSLLTPMINYDSSVDYNIYIVEKSFFGKINSIFNPKFLVQDLN